MNSISITPSSTPKNQDATPDKDRRFSVRIADYSNPQDAADITTLLDIYANDVMGGSAPLPISVKTHLIEELAKRPYALSLLCHTNEQAIGLINCFESFSTFKCKPLLNIHDIMVIPEFRGLGISQLLLQQVEKIARERGCCKLTLEVLEGNTPAKNAYEKFGFSAYVLDPAMGEALFWQKNL